MVMGSQCSGRFGRTLFKLLTSNLIELKRKKNPQEQPTLFFDYVHPK